MIAMLSDLRKQYPKDHSYNSLSKRLGYTLYGRYALNIKP